MNIFSQSSIKVPPQKPEPKKSVDSNQKIKSYLKWGLLVLVSMCLGAFLMAVIISSVTISEFVLNLAPKTFLNGVNVLMLGLDKEDTVQRSDTIMVMHLDWEHNRIGVLSIPRDTRVLVPGLGYTKINHAYAKGKVKLAKAAVSNLLGVPIDHAIVLKIRGVEHIVDQLGGIKMTITKRMYYVDQSGDLYIDLKPGTQNLNGKEAMAYLRFRHDENADIGRIERQQTFLRAIMDKVTNSIQFFEVPILIRQLSKNFESDLSFREMIGLAVQFKDAFKGGKIEAGTLPGEPTLIGGVSYWRVSVKEADKVVQTILAGTHVDTERMVQNSKVQTVDSQSSQEARRHVTMKEMDRVLTQTQKPAEELKVIGKKIRVEILNGYGQPGVANRAAALLKAKGIDVVKMGNAGVYKYEETLLVDWRGKVDSTLILAQALLIDPSKIIVYDKPSKPLDATLVLGKDWPQIEANLVKNSGYTPKSTGPAHIKHVQQPVKGVRWFGKH